MKNCCDKCGGGGFLGRPTRWFHFLPFMCPLEECDACGGDGYARPQGPPPTPPPAPPGRYYDAVSVADRRMEELRQAIEERYRDWVPYQPPFRENVEYTSRSGCVVTLCEKAEGVAWLGGSDGRAVILVYDDGFVNPSHEPHPNDIVLQRPIAATPMPPPAVVCPACKGLVPRVVDCKVCTGYGRIAPASQWPQVITEATLQSVDVVSDAQGGITPVGTFQIQPGQPMSGEQYARAQLQTKQFVACMEAIAVLRQDEGSSVTILCDNPDGPPNNAIECCGDWTGWKDTRFEGATLLECLTKAVESYQDPRRCPQ